MADENIVTNIVAKSDFSNLIADLNKVSFSLTKLQDQLVASNKMLAAQVSVMNRSFAETLRSTGQFSTHFVSLTSDVDKFGSQLDKGQLKLGKFFQVYRQHAQTSGGLIRDLAKQQVQLQNAIMQPLGRNAEGLMQYNVHIPRGLDLIKNKSAIARQELQILNKVVQEGANQLINWGKNTQWAGRQLTVGLTVPLAAFGKATADAFKQADQELTRLTKVYGGIAQTSAQELGKVRAEVSQTAADISKAYGVSFNETIGLAADIAATGKTGNELLGSIRETTRLAVLGEVDRQDAMKATLAIQSAFKSNTDELAQSINFLNSVENQTSTTLNDLVEAIPKAGPIIKGLGGDVQDLALYLTAMREGGISATEGANALKSGLASLINPTKVAKEMFAGFGISLTDIVQKNAGDTTATLFALQAALDRLDPLQKQQALEQLFGKFQFARMNALFENLGRQGSQTLQVMDLMKASSQDLANLAGRELAQVTESASGKYRRAVEGLKADLAGIGEQFLKINTSLINFVDGIIKFVQKLPDPIKQVLGFMGMLTAAAGPLIMLTGVLGNFFGYIIKGAYHFKSLFKGGEGWKLLTPEILAAQKAGDLVEQTFYSDAAAATVLKKAIHDLTLEFELLQQKAQSGSVAVNPGITTAAGNAVMSAGVPRTVNAQSKYLGKPGSRDFSHQNPTAGKTPEQKMAETIFAVTPGTKPVNQRIGANPQIFTEGDLPSIQGLTRISGVSTGIVAEEAAKWHTLMGTLSMMSKKEVAQLKKEIATTGTFSSEISQTFAQLLGPITNITNNAAKQSALIVKELQAQKISLDVARQRIIELNYQTEALMAETTSKVAQSLGRTANLTTIPLIDQPVVNTQGKSNFKELFRKNRPASNILSKIAGALGVKTWGGPYSSETTMPKRMATGGTVPGTGNTDTVPAMLTPGEFVINKQATEQNLPLLMAINDGQQSSGMGYQNGGQIRFQRGHAGAQLPPNNLDLSQLATGTKNVRYVAQGIPIWMTDVMNQELRSGRPGLTGMQIWNQFATGLRSGRHPLEPLSLIANQTGLSGEDVRLNKLFSEMMNDLSGPNASRQFVGGTPDSFENYFNKNYVPKLSPELNRIWHSYGTAYGSRGSRGLVATGTVHIDPKTGAMTGIRGRNNPLTGGISTGVLGSFSGPGFNASKSRQMNSINLVRAALSHIRNPLAGSGFHTYKRFNRGGLVPGASMPRGYQLGGMVMPMLASTAGWMGGSALGSMIGGDTGSMIGGMVGSMGLPAMLSGAGRSADDSIPKLGRFKTAVSAIVGLPGPVKVLGGLLAIGAAVKTINDKIEEHRKTITLGFAPTEDAAQRLGIKYNSLTKQMSDFAEQTKLTKANIEEFYAATQSSGVPGLNLTIKQLKELKDTVKKDFPDYVKIFDSARPDEVVRKAQQLKAQFVAGGMSSEEATKKIYAMISVSNKANQSIKAIANEGFVSIKDKASAASQSIKTFNDLLKQGNTDQLSASFETVVDSIQQAEKALIGTKDAQGKLITESEAFNAQLEKIKSTQLGTTELGNKGVEALSKQNAMLAMILNKSDTLAGAYAKIKLYLSGIDVDLKGMNSQMAELLAKTIQLQTQELNSMDGKYGSIVKKINEYNAASSSAKTIKAQQNIQVNLDDQIKKHQKIIDQIKEEADARIDALDRQNASENYNAQLKKLQLQYQDELASGNMSAAAQAQLDIQQLVGGRQRDLAVNAIRDKEAADVKAQELIIEGLQNKIESSQKAVEKATASADASLKKAAELQTTLNDLVTATINAGNGLDETEKKQLANLQTKLKGMGFGDLATQIGGQGSMIPFASGMGYSSYGIEGIGKSTLDKVINANQELKVNDSALYGLLKTKFNVTPSIPVTTSSGARGTTVSTVPVKSLTDAGYKLNVGTPVTIDGQNYVISGTPDRSGNIQITKKAMGGYIRHYGPGGGVYGPGTGTSDSIPAMLSNGEYVIRASAVQAVGTPMLDQINKMAMGGLATRYDIPNKMIMPANTMGYNRGGSVSNYNVGGLTMNFANGGQVDGRMLFEQFKGAMALEKLKSGGSKLA